MPNKLKIDALRADLAAVEDLHRQAIKFKDHIAEFQLSQRIEELKDKISELEIKKETAANVALLFGGTPVMGSRGIAAEFAGSILEKFQDLISRSFAINELGSIGGTGPIPLKQSSSLMVTEIARGSFGFILDEMDDQSNLFNTKLKNIVENVINLLNKIASPNEKDFEEAIENLDSRSLKTIRELFSTLDSSEATMRLVEDAIDFSFDRKSIELAKLRTDATTIEEDEELTSGIFHGILPESKKFEIMLEGKRIISGSIDKVASDQYDSFHLAGKNPIDLKWEFKMRRRVIKKLNKPPSEVYKLLSFEKQID